jgi:hypothetical protein
LSSYYTSANTFTDWTPTPAAGGANAFFTITNTTSTSATDGATLATEFSARRTLTVTGATENAGLYHVINAGSTFNNPGYTVTVNVRENIPSGTAGGVLHLNPPAGGVTDLNWDVRLGRADLYNDGLIGYYVDGDAYAHLNSVHTPVELDGVGYLKPIGGARQNYLRLSFNAEASHGDPGADVPAAAPEPGSTFVTLLMDPHAAVHATTGLLPTKTLELQGSFTKRALENMAVTFRTGPILTNPKKIQMPLPNVKNGEWEWQQVTVGTGTIVSKAVTQIIQTAQLPDTPMIMEDGWLALKQFDEEDHDGG